MKQTIELLRLEAARNLRLIATGTGFAVNPDTVGLSNLRRIASEWSSFVRTPAPSYALSSTGAIVDGLFDELARDLHNLRTARYDWVAGGCMGEEPYSAQDEGELATLLWWCATRVGMGAIAPVKGWATMAF